MPTDSNVAPIIVRKKKIIKGDGHHGGAWKVAYADFVTAMMAFFMLMWLLNATTEKQRKGLADYFSPTVSISRVSGGGDDALNGDSVFTQQVLAKQGTGASSVEPTIDNSGSATAEEEPGEARQDQGDPLADLERELMGRAGESLVSQDLLKHVTTRVTDEGLVIELFDRDGARLFAETGEPTDLLRALAIFLTEAADIVTNPVAIKAHASRVPIVQAEDPVWDVTARRSSVMRELLLDGGMTADRIVRLTANGDAELTDPNPMAQRNNRLEIVFLRYTKNETF